VAYSITGHFGVRTLEQMENSNNTPRANSQAKHWCFTINNPELDADKEILQTADEMEYCVCQLERGEDGTLHLQGVIGFKKRRYFRTVKALHPRAHWEIARSVPASIAYAQKSETRVDGPWIYGNPPAGAVQGKRSDLDKVVKMIRKGRSLKQIFEKAPNSTLRYTNNISRLVLYYTPPRDFASRVYLFYGPTRTGKTKAALSFPSPFKGLCPKHGNLWMDGYDPMLHETVIFDDFYGGIKWTELLNLTDRHPFQVQIKGASIQFRPKTIIFTSNQHYDCWYPNMDRSALKARFAEFGGVILFNNDKTMTLELGSFPDELRTESREPSQSDDPQEEQPHDSGNSQEMSLNTPAEE